MAALKSLELRIVPTSAIVTSDPGLLRRILQNLVGNAVRYSNSGRILLGARLVQGAVRVEVRDTGPGIAEADQDRIFREFERLDARASASEGLGLGLAIVERACARLGHPLGLTSRLGKGTCFSVTLPHADAPTEPRRSATTLQTRNRLRHKGLIVMMVENDTELRQAMCLLMEGWGVSVLEASSACTAMALLDEIQITPDALLIDYHLGHGVNGLKLLKDIRKIHGPIPARIISADRSPDLRQRCAERRADLMSKPIDADQLEAFLVESLLRQKPGEAPRF